MSVLGSSYRHKRRQRTGEDHLRTDDRLWWIIFAGEWVQQLKVQENERERSLSKDEKQNREKLYLQPPATGGGNPLRHPMGYSNSRSISTHLSWTSWPPRRISVARFYSSDLFLFVCIFFLFFWKQMSVSLGHPRQCDADNGFNSWNTRLVWTTVVLVLFVSFLGWPKTQ